MDFDRDSDDDVGFAEADFSLGFSAEIFRRTYEEGMELVEEVSAYLDGPGREAARKLPRDVSLAYANESMRLTTRLMQVAAWLLVRRAVEDGDISHDEAMSEKYRLSAKDVAHAPRLAGTIALPMPLLELIERSERLFERVERIDTRLRLGNPTIDPGHPMALQLTRIEAFFRENLTRDIH